MLVGVAGAPGCMQLFGHAGHCDREFREGKRQRRQTARASASAEQQNLRFCSTPISAAIPIVQQTAHNKRRKTQNIPDAQPKIVVSQCSSQRQFKRKPSDGPVQIENPQRIHHTAASEGNCPICLSPISSNLQQTTTTSCGHLFCRGCLQKWLQQKRNCPMCKASIGHTRSSLPSGTTPVML